MNIFDHYFPPVESIDELTVQAARDRVVSYFSARWPDEDVRPGSIAGDGYITPFAYLVAGFEIAAERMRSDADTEQVSKGIIYDCDWVRLFLRNFAVVDTDGIFATGIVRLVFSTDTQRSIPRRIRFLMSSTASNVFMPRLANEGDIIIMPEGTSRSPVANVFPLFRLSSSLFAADIPVYGQMDTQVLVGDSGAVDVDVPGLTGVTALTTFIAGTGPTSLPQLAKRARTAFHAASLNNRLGARSFARREYPDLLAVSPVLSGDYEMMRGSVSPLGIERGALDVLIRSTQFQNVESHVIRLTYYAEQNSQSLDRFIGKLSLAGVPVSIDSIRLVDSPTVNLDNGKGSLVIFSRSKDQVKAPKLSAGFSDLEDLWLSIAMPRDPNTEAAVITPQILDDGTQYADFVITYRTDPLVPVVSDYLTSKDVAPVGCSVMVKPYLPVKIESLTVRYTRDRGASMLVAQATSEIFDYIKSLGHPSIYSDGAISDTMLYAGASAVRGIECRATVRWSLAGRYVVDDSLDPEVDYVSWLAASDPCPTITINNTAALTPRHRFSDVFAAVGAANIGYLMDVSAIHLNEEI